MKESILFDRVSFGVYLCGINLCPRPRSVLVLAGTVVFSHRLWYVRLDGNEK